MSIKKYFEVAESIQSLSNKSAAEIADQVESVGYQEQDIIEEERFIPHVDFSKPGNFARYGSAVSYYKQSLERVYNTYPYDGSLKERLEWMNESTYLDLYIFNKRYPRTTGYVVLTADGYGASTLTDGYGAPNAASDNEYIQVKGGPNVNPDGMSPLALTFTGSNYYEPTKNRGSNLEFDLASNGASIEFWLKKDAFITGSTEKEVIFDMWNGEELLSPLATPDYVRLRLELTGATDGVGPFRLTAYSGSTGFFDQNICPATFTTASVADGNWHHYAVTMASASVGVTTRFYVDGRISNETTLGSAGLNNAENTSLQAYIGALIGSPSGSSAAAASGKLSGSLDEFRYWKTQRTSQDIGRFWFTQVGGGVNSDPTPFIETSETANVDLGVYFKFNEGITGQSATDSVVLDYSGRISNGAWTGYTSTSRNTGSAIISSSAATKEFEDPIIYAFHPKVVALNEELELSGSEHDVTNNASMYSSVPSWITEEDDEGSGDLKKLTQILSSYFDTLHLQIGSLNKIKDISYPSGSNKPIPFSERFLGTYGFVAPDLFVDADVLEKLADRSENKVFDKSLHDIKNTIYQNIYNNLSYIYKSKGTEKAFRNLIRCFGIDDELVKINMYGDNIEYELRNSRRNVVVADRFVNFNTPENQYANVYNYSDATNANSVNFLPSVASLTGGYSYTLEAEVLMPKKLDPESIVYFDTNVLSSSLFGIHGTTETAATTWPTPDRVNFQVYAVRDERSSDNARFVLTGTAGGFVPHLTSSIYEGVYNNTRWNLAVRVRPEQYPIAGLSHSAGESYGGLNGNYIVELHGVQADAGDIMQEFTVSGTVSAPPAGFITGSRRIYLGAHREDFTGNVLQTSDIKVNACRFWLDYLNDETLNSHLLDTENHGALQPHLYAFEFDTSGSNGDVTKFDTLAFNWEFLTNTGSNASQQFIVDDLSSGSAALTTFGNLGPLLNKQYTGLGNNFLASSTTAIDKDFVVSSKLNLPENIASQDMVKVLGTQDQELFTSESRPVDFYFAFEKSMYQVISEEMINYFANLKDLHNLIGDSVEKYRPHYKQLKFLRHKFFEKVSNDTLDFDRFYEFYKWFDSSLSFMLGQLVPASADFSENVRTIIENHLLERPKYRRIFPFLERVGALDITASFNGINIIDSTAGASPDDLPAGTLLFSNTSPTKRQFGSSNPTQISNWKHVHAPQHPTTVTTYDYYNTYYDALTYSAGTTTVVGYEIALDSSWSAPDTVTWSAWVKYNPSDGHRTLFQFGDEGAQAIKLYNTGEVYFTWGHAPLGSNGQWMTAGAGISGDSWHHIAVAYDGTSNSNVPVIYVDGVAQTLGGVSPDVQPTGTRPTRTATAMLGSSIALSYSSLNDTMRAGEIASVSLWGKKLSAAEVTEIYNKTTGFAPATGFNPGPQNLATHSAYSDLVSWWRFGIDIDGAFHSGSVKDQKGVNNASGSYWVNTPPGYSTLTTLTSADNAVIGGGTYTDTINYQENENIYWWRYVAERTDLPLSNSLNPVRADLLSAIRQSYDRRIGAPFRFDAEGTVTFGGVGRPPINRPNALFPAIQPFGPTVSASNIPTNIMMSFDTDVESLIETVDEYHPTFKQRLGFSLDPSINTFGADGGAGLDKKNNGNVFAPFSLYSSSVRTGYNIQVEQWKSGTMITNLHDDFVSDHDIPAQGPFTEKFVGGRQYRHTELNQGSDTRESRAEGFRLLMGTTETGYVGALGIVPANYPFSDTPSGSAEYGYLPDLPMAYRFREETSKRPVNIKNILMTTASVGTRLSGTIMHNPIGNYQKNYQVINTGGRTINDPFFNDQSFDFALYPEVASLRGRVPGQAQVLTNTKSTIFDQASNQYASIGASSIWNDIIGNAGGTSKMTFSVWFRLEPAGGASYQRFLSFGSYMWVDTYESTRWLRFWTYWNGTLRTWYTANYVYDESVWNHVVWTYDATSTSNEPVIYLNGASMSLSTGGTAPTGTWYGLPGAVDSSFAGVNTAAFGGAVNEVAIWNDTISPAQVLTMYNNGIGGVDLSSLGIRPVSWWRMGNGAGDSTTTVYDQIGSNNATLVNLPTTSSSDSPGGPEFNSALNYALPDRSGANSNQSIIVNRFSAPGDYKTLSRGYLDPAHEELSVYNASPYRNREVIDYGFQGSASLDPSIQGSIRVVDQIGKNRGLNQLASLHCGPFGSDAAYGSVPALTYITTPSWTKNNRNSKKKILSLWPPSYALFPNTNSQTNADTGFDIGSAATWDALIGGDDDDAKPFSICAWIYLDPTNSAPSTWNLATIFSAGYNGFPSYAGRILSLYCPSLDGVPSSPKVLFFIPGTSSNHASAWSKALQANRWYHIAATLDVETSISQGRTIARLYVDGQAVPSGQTKVGMAPKALTTYNTYIGVGNGDDSGGTAGSSEGFPGGISNLSVWNKVLTPDEVRQLAENPHLGGLNPRETAIPAPGNLLAWYNLQQGIDTGTTITNRVRETANTDGSTTNGAVSLRSGGPTGNPTEVSASQPLVSVYDNLFVQHTIPRSERQYAWVTASFVHEPKTIETSNVIAGQWNQYQILGYDPPACASASVMTTQAEKTTYPYYSYSSAGVLGGGSLMLPGLWENSFNGANGVLIIDPASTTTHTIGQDGDLTATAGTPSAEFFGAATPAIPAGSSNPSLAGLHVGTGTNWIPFVGGAAANAMSFALVVWVYARSRGGGSSGRVLDLAGERRLLATSASIATLEDTHYRMQFNAKRDAGGYYHVSSPDLPYNEWFQVGVRYGGGDPAGSADYYGKLVMFINGAEVEETSGATDIAEIDAAGTCHIGNVDGGGRAWDGFISDLAVHSLRTALPSGGLTASGFLLAYNTEIQNRALGGPSGSITYGLHGRPRNPITITGLASNWYAVYHFNPFAQGSRTSPTTGDSEYVTGDARVFLTDGSPHFTVYNRSTSSYPSPDGISVGASNFAFTRFSANSVDSLNILTNNRNGPYGWPTWKQIRTGETKVARLMRKNNLIGTTIPPGRIPDMIRGKKVSFIQPTRPNDFIDFVESPVVYGIASPFYFYFEDNTEDANPENNIMMKTPSFSNEYDYFSHEQLNNRLGLKIDLKQPKVYDSIVEFALNSDLSLMMDYSQRIYPAAVNAFKATVRGRTAYNIDNIWNSNRQYRSLRYGGATTATLGQRSNMIVSQSTWPMDAHLNYSVTQSATSSDGSGPLMNLYGTWSQKGDLPRVSHVGSWPGTGWSELQYPSPHAAPTYALRVPAGNTQGDGTAAEGAANRIVSASEVAFGGDTVWMAPSQAGKDPYKNYTLISDRIRQVAKDYSILPEFRISSHMKYFVEDKGGDFLAPLDNIFELSGAAVSSSLDPTFYRTYTNADFLKYFKVVDDDLNEKRSGDLKVVRDKVSLKCDAILKFVPYKGFYPAERTAEIGSIFSQSYGPQLCYMTGAYTDESGKYWGAQVAPGLPLRPIMDPLMSPGILFNTIKSGIATSDVVLMGTQIGGLLPDFISEYIGVGDQKAVDKDGNYYGTHRGSPGTSTSGYGQDARVLWCGSGSMTQTWDLSAFGLTMGATMMTQLPFEALYNPTQYFSNDWLKSRITKWGLAAGSSGDAADLANNPDGRINVLLDRHPTGSYSWGPASLSSDAPSSMAYHFGLLFTGSVASSSAPERGIFNTTASAMQGPLYEHAIDNFLCETTNMFMSDLTNFQSSREEDFRKVRAGTTYTMVMRLYRSDVNPLCARSSSAEVKFDMYSRRSAFGPPVGADLQFGLVSQLSQKQGGPNSLSFSHVTPPYYDGSAKVKFIFSPSDSGYPTLNDIISNTTMEFEREEYTPNLNAANASSSVSGDPNADIRMQIDNSFNLMERLQQVPDGTVTQKDRWLIQSKFETPILNFAGVSTGSVPAETYVQTEATASATQMITRGMWHQYGSPCAGADGVWATLEDGSDESLANIVGFKVGTPDRVGKPRKEYRLEEAIVAIPFKTTKNRRQFIRFPQQEVRTVSEDGKLISAYTQADPRSKTYQHLVAAMDKYVFPPRFNFVDFETVDPVLMYIFEFSTKLTEKDLTDIWQNLPPELGEKFEQDETVVEEKELVDLILDKGDQIQWMVFKVKRKAQKDFEVYRRSLVTDNVSAMTPRITSPYSYNWPYDYFSLIELAKIEEEVQYVSADMKLGQDLSEGERLTVVHPDPVGRAAPQQPPGTSEEGEE
jgi:hypothetical protein